MLENTSIISEFYFEIIEISEGLIFIKSKNTSHYWKLISENGRVVIYHKHFSRGWHKHKVCKSLNAAVGLIKKHDEFVIERIRKSFIDYKYNPVVEQYFYY